MTEHEQAAAETLVAQLEDLAAWLPPEAWVQPDPTPFDPPWMVWTERHAPGVISSTIEPSRMAEAVLASEIRLPGGASPLTFGSEYSEPASSPDVAGRAGRCAVVTREEARAMDAALDDANGLFGSIGWWLADAGDWIRVEMRPAIIDVDMTCRPGMLFAPEIYVPVPVADPPDREFDIDACSLFQSETLRDAFDLSAYVYLSVAGQEHYAEDPAYRSCYWFSGISGGIGFEGEPWDGFVLGAVRTETTTGEEAEQLARELFGVATDAIDGHPVWLRGCSSTGSEQGTCASAVVSAPPFLVIVEVDSGGSPGDSAVIAVRTVIPEILANLAAWQAERP